MASLGSITHIRPSQESPRPLEPIAEYDIKRGLDFGPIPTYDIVVFEPVKRGPLLDYVVRQIRVIFRQLWPTHGQRFPQ